MVSIIIPVYNVEDYLRPCLDSVLAQTHADWEAILIDDGSSDSSPAICDEYAARDGRFRVLHLENGGVSAARNAALKIARGDFITFLDSDDLLSPGAIQHLRDLCLKHGADMSVCPMLRLEEDGSIVPVKQREGKTVQLEGEEKMSAFLSGKLLGNAVCGNLYRRELFGDVRFPVGVTRAEDAYVSCRVIHAAGRIVIDDTPQYIYRNRADSVMHRRCCAPKDFDSWEMYAQERIFVSRHYPRLRRRAETRSCYTVLKLVVRSAMSGYSVKEIDGKMQRELRRTLSSFLKSGHSRRRKIVALIAAAHIDLARAFVRMAKVQE